MERKKLEKLIDEKLNLTVIKLNLDAKGVSDEAKIRIIEIYQKLFERAFVHQI